MTTLATRTQRRPDGGAVGATLRRACACGSGASPGCTTCEGGDRLRRRAVGPRGPETAPPIVADVLRSPGRPLDRSARAFAESRFGRDFGHVRIHTDSRAGASARAVSASAYTVGRDVVFADGQYAPATREGRFVLAHELAHVVQQSGSQASGPLRIGRPDDATERQADVIARAAVDGGAPLAGTGLLQPGVAGRLLARAIHQGNISDEGTCEHLACNSRFACEDSGGVTCPDGTRNATSKTGKKWRPLFTCDHDCEAEESCDDTDHWMALPHKRFTRRKCGQTLVICANGTSTQAHVRDRSDRGVFEVSRGIQDTLGVPHGTFTGSIYGDESDPGFARDGNCKPQPKPTPSKKPKAEAEPSPSGEDGGDGEVEEA